VQVVFTPRIIVFNESFVPVGTNQKSLGPTAIIWHEVTQGRMKEDITSAFHKFLLTQRDTKYVRFWLDNCSAQNKNWCLISFFVYIVNSQEISADEIEIYFFESGHTYMSADWFHHQCEECMQNYRAAGENSGGKIYDFDDFHDAIQSVKVKNTKVVDMNLNDFREWLDYSSKAKLDKKNNPDRPYLASVVKMGFVRGKNTMFYANEYESDYKEFDFLMVKYLKQSPPSGHTRKVMRGIQKERKNEIVKALTPLMPENRRIFWRSLPVANDELIDLLKEVGD